MTKIIMETSVVNDIDLAYLHVMHLGNDSFLKEIREAWSNTLLVNRPCRPLEEIDADIEANLADVAPVGGWALANPDFVERLKTGAQLNEPDRTTFYGGDGKGYTAYPFLNSK